MATEPDFHGQLAVTLITLFDALATVLIERGAITAIDWQKALTAAGQEPQAFRELIDAIAERNAERLQQ
jgi:carbon monoxide dehydrogenase subunit G